MYSVRIIGSQFRRYVLLPYSTLSGLWGAYQAAGGCASHPDHSRDLLRRHPDRLPSTSPWPSQPVQHGGEPYAAGPPGLPAVEWRAFHPLGRTDRSAHRCYCADIPLCPQGRAAGLQVLYGTAETGRSLCAS